MQTRPQRHTGDALPMRYAPKHMMCRASGAPTYRPGPRTGQCRKSRDTAYLRPQPRQREPLAPLRYGTSQLAPVFAGDNTMLRNANTAAAKAAFSLASG